MSKRSNCRCYNDILRHDLELNELEIRVGELLFDRLKHVERDEK